MQMIRLSQGRLAIVDDQDFARLSSFHWSYRGERNGAPGYAIRHKRVGKKYRTTYLHREIMQPPPGHEVIFLNHDRLDCRRENLRIATKQEAIRHHRVRRDSQSGLKGIRFNPELGKWTADLHRNGRCYRIGSYESQGAAAAAYEAEVKRENPDLHSAPELVDRRELARQLRKTRPDAPRRR